MAAPVSIKTDANEQGLHYHFPNDYHSFGYPAR